MDKRIINAHNLIEVAKHAPGYSIFRNLLKARSSYLIFLDNKTDLERTLKHIKLNHEEVYSTDSSLRRHQRRVMKELYNLISAAQNVKEHLNQQNKTYCQHIGGTSLHYFFRELRNMLVHHNTFALISKRKFEWIDDQMHQDIFQSMDKASFSGHLTRRITELSGNPNKKKQLKQTEDVLVYLNSLPDGFSFDALLTEYYQTIILFYRTWLIAFVTHQYQQLEDFSDQLVPIHAVITNLPVSKLQNRYLRMLLSTVTKLRGVTP